MANQTKIIEGRIKAWLPSHSDARDLDGDATRALNSMGFASHDMAPEWTLLGEARIEVTMLPQADLVAGQIASLRREQGDLIAKSNRIEARIQSLLAIENSSAAAAS